MTQTVLQSAVEKVNQIILGKPQAVKLALSCMLAKGHLLIEDVPGVGKTTLAQTLAKTLGLSFQRIQFTSDMLPADIIGVSVFDRDNNRFTFHPGPIFTQFILADEVNRATPRTQSALLEAMEEQQITVDSQTHSLPEPFFVIATQNPSHQIGTYPLPESQLDRFLMRIQLGYPDAESEKALLLGQDRRELLKNLSAVMTAETLLSLQQQTEQVHVSESLARYIQHILNFTRESGQFEHGLSPRSGLALLRAAQAWAILEERELVLPEDVQAVLASVVNHRLQAREHNHALNMADTILNAVPVV